MSPGHCGRDKSILFTDAWLWRYRSFSPSVKGCFPSNQPRQAGRAVKGHSHSYLFELSKTGGWYFKGGRRISARRLSNGLLHTAVAKLLKYLQPLSSCCESFSLQLRLWELFAILGSGCADERADGLGRTHSPNAHKIFDLWPLL